MYLAHYIYRAKVVAEEGRKFRPTQTTPAMQKHTHMMKRTLGCPALRTGMVGYQLSPHTHTQQHQSLDYSNSTQYMYIHSTCTYTFSVATRSGPSVELICKAASIHIHVQTTYMYVHVHCATCSQPHGRQLLFVVLHVLYTVQVHGCQGFPTIRMWGVLET